MSSALLGQLQAAASAAGSSSGAEVAALLTAWAPQLLQLEQQAAAGSAPADDADAARLNRWVARYCTDHEADALVAANASALARAPTAAAAASARHDSGASGASEKDAAVSAPAPLFFYLLQHPQPASRDLCMQFLSALYTDPASDQDFYWLNDPAAFVQQLREKIARTQQQNAQIAQRYAQTKDIDAVELSRHVILFAGIVEVLQALLHTRSRALASQLTDVRALLAEAGREKWRAQWQLWMASSDTSQGSSNLLALESKLAASADANAWHHAVAMQRRHKSTLHARAFRSFLQPTAQPLMLELAPLLVDREYSEESELFVDRLWSLATNSFQHDAHGENEAGGAGGDESSKVSCGWSYPPPSVHALLDVFLLPDATPDASASASTAAAATPPPSYKLWLLYYLLLDFEQRNEAADPAAPMLSVEFAHAAGLSLAQQKLIAGMVHMDAAYAPNESSSSSSSGKSNGVALLSSARRASFLSALECFSHSYDALLSQPDFPFVSSILASVVALQQWSGGVTFFENCFTANAALVAASISTSQRQAQMARYNANRRAESAAMPLGAVQVHAVFYSTLHHVLYLHVLLQMGLFFESVQFIRRQTQLDDATGSLLHTPLQVVMWRYWNSFLLHQRQYDVLLKQVALAPLEERLLLSFWKQHLTPQTQATSGATSAAPTLTTADLVVLYAFEHHDIERGLRFFAAFQRMQKKQHAAQRLALRIPADIVSAYAKLVHFDLRAAVDAPEDGAEGLEEDESDELDLCAIQLREVERSVAALQINNRPLLQRILSAHSADDVLDAADMDQSVDMLDAQRSGSELNPFAPSNERVRKDAADAAAAAAASKAKAQAKAQAEAAAAALARSQSSPAKPSPSKPSPAKPARNLSESEAGAASAAAPALAPAPVSEHKSPEKTPRVQRLPASQSAAKAKRAQIAKDEAEAKAKEQAEAAEKQKQQQSMDGVEEDGEASPEEMFPSFSSPAPPSRSSSSQRALVTPPPAAATAAAAASAVPSPVQPMVSPSRVLLSATKPLAFSDLSEEQSRDPAAFLLPLHDSTAAASNAAIAAAAVADSHGDAAPVRTASKRATRATKSDSVERATPPPASPVPSAAALPSFTPLSSAHFTPSLLAPSALTASGRIRSSRKRPLLSQPPMLLATTAPLCLASRPLSPAHQLTAGGSDGNGAAASSSSEAKAPSSKRAGARATRATRAKQPSPTRMEESEEDELQQVQTQAEEADAEGKEDEAEDEEEDEVEESVAGDENGSATTAEDESVAADDRPSRRTSPQTTRTRRATRRSADLDSADAAMDEVAQAPVTRSTRRATAHTPAYAHTAESNPFQRSASMSSTGTAGRRSRAAPIFIDESLLMSGPPAAAAVPDDRSEMDDGEDDGESVSGTRRSTRRGASSRSTLSVTASAEPSPSPSTNTSPTRPTRLAARRAARNIAASSPAPSAARKPRARASATPAAAANESAPASSRRPARHVETTDAELPPVSTRSTRSKGK